MVGRVGNGALTGAVCVLGADAPSLGPHPIPRSIMLCYHASGFHEVAHWLAICIYPR
jgi:hypothetical protein